MGDNIFGMDIRRFSVLFIAAIIILAIFSSFSNLQSVQQKTNITINTNNVTGHLPGKYYSYIYNKTIYLSPNIDDLKYIYGSFADTIPPNYTLNVKNFSIPLFFNLSEKNTSLLNLLINYLSRNASMVTPSAYGELLSVAMSSYVNVSRYQNTTVEPFPLNVNDTENYSKTRIIVYYAKNFTVPKSFPRDWTYPPSDNVFYKSLSTKIINNYTVKTFVIITYSISYSLVSNYSTGSLSCPGGQLYNYLYYDANVYYTFYYYVNVNGSVSEYAVISGSTTIPYTGGTIGPYTESTNVQVPGGSINVQATAGLSFVENETYSIIKIPCNESNQSGYAYNITVKYYPVLSSITNISNIYNFYEYNVIFQFKIIMYNGTNPTTYIDENSTSLVSNNRTINVNISYLIWSSAPSAYHISIKTNDSINVDGIVIHRTWNAGVIQIIPKINEITSLSTHNYYLNFSIASNLESSPDWIYEKMPYNSIAAKQYFYLEQNASLATTLMNFIKNTINSSDIQYTNFEYFILASQFVMYNFNTTSVWNNMLELQSFGNISWALVDANILNLSEYPKIVYNFGTLQFFNVSKIPQIYNSSIFFNVTGNYEVYLVDLYNGVNYKGFDRVPFGNIYEINNVSFYEFNNKEIPYVGEPLLFYNADYINGITYAVFVYPTPTNVEITAIWNGTAWIT